MSSVSNIVNLNILGGVLSAQAPERTVTVPMTGLFNTTITIAVRHHSELTSMRILPFVVDPATQPPGVYSATSPDPIPVSEGMPAEQTSFPVYMVVDGEIVVGYLTIAADSRLAITIPPMTMNARFEMKEVDVCWFSSMS